MSIKTQMTEQVAAQIDRQWPYSRLNVTSESHGESVTVGPNSVQLTDDYWHVPARGSRTAGSGTTAWTPPSSRTR